MTDLYILNVKYVIRINDFLIKLSVLLVFVLAGGNAFTQKNDTLFFLNGDRVSGEIKQYKYGFLTYKTYGLGTVQVKYDKISSFRSKKSFDILLSNGIRRFGSFDSSRLEQTVKILTLNDTVITPLIEVVEIIPIKSGFWRKLSGSFDVGYSYAKTNSLSQFTGSGDIRYIQQKYHADLGVNTINTIQEGQDDSKKNDVSLGVYKRFNKSWFAGTALSAEQNTQLGLDLRIQTAWVAGNEVIHTNSNNLLIYSGLVLNKEFSVDSSFSRWNVDVVGTLSYRLFRFRQPETSITSQFTVYPSLTVAGRYRMDYNLNAKIEIVSDLYFKLSFYENFDNKPTSENASTNDYRISTSIGYSF